MSRRPSRWTGLARHCEATFPSDSYVPDFGGHGGRTHAVTIATRDEYEPPSTGSIPEIDADAVAVPSSTEASRSFPSRTRRTRNAEFNPCRVVWKIDAKFDAGRRFQSREFTGPAS